jgi:SulP family sulfate permease
MNNPFLKRLLPFLRWLPYSGATLRADFIAGLTVALVLVPQSMAYAQLAGMPPYYGLYAAFLPVMVTALWGSSNQLGTAGGRGVLLTASTLAPGRAGLGQFIALAIMLALMVGIPSWRWALSLGVAGNFRTRSSSVSPTRQRSSSPVADQQADRRRWAVGTSSRTSGGSAAGR